MIGAGVAALLRRGGIGPIGGPNKMRDGSVSSIAQATASWFTWFSTKVNDGLTDVLTTVYFGRTSDNSAANNNSRGVVVTFTSPLALRRFKLYAYPRPVVQYNFTVSYWNGSAWVEVSRQANGTSYWQTYDFNLDGAISSNKWKFEIKDWVVTAANFYASELEAYL